MPKWVVQFQREVVQIDTVERVIQADSLEHLSAIADALASDFDFDCPDDYVLGAGSDECRSWSVRHFQLAAADAVPDELPDGLDIDRDWGEGRVA